MNGSSCEHEIGEVVPPPSPRRPPHSPRARPGPPPSSPLARPALAGCLGALAECPLLRCGVRTRRQPQHVARATRVHGAESFARAARQRAYARHVLSPSCTADNMPRSFTARRTSMNACEANVVEALLQGLQAGAFYFDPNDRHLALPWPLAQCRRARLRAALDDLDAALRGAVDQRSLTVRALQRAAANGQPLAMDAFCDHLDALSAACCTASLSRHMRHEGFSTHAVLPRALAPTRRADRACAQRIKCVCRGARARARRPCCCASRRRA